MGQSCTSVYWRQALKVSTGNGVNSILNEYNLSAMNQFGQCGTCTWEKVFDTWQPRQAQSGMQFSDSFCWLVLLEYLGGMTPSCKGNDGTGRGPKMN